MLKTSISLIIGFSFSASAAVIDYRTDINEWFSGAQCASVNKAEISALKDSGLCSVQDLSAIVDLTKDVNPTLEHSLFSEAASQQVDILNCDLRELQQAGSQTTSGSKIRKKIIDDVARKLPMLSLLHEQVAQHEKSMKEAITQVNGIQSSVSRSLLQLNSPSVQSSLQQYNKQAKYHREKMLEAARPFNALMMTLWNGDSPFMSDFILNVLKAKKSPEAFAKDAAQSSG